MRALGQAYGTQKGKTSHHASGQTQLLGVQTVGSPCTHISSRNSARLFLNPQWHLGTQVSLKPMGTRQGATTCPCPPTQARVQIDLNGDQVNGLM